MIMSSRAFVIHNSTELFTASFKDTMPMIQRKVAHVFAAMSLFPLILLAQSGPMLMSPYLQAVTTNSIYVLVESLSGDPVIVEYGSTTAYSDKAQTESQEQTSEGTIVHNIHLTGLAANSVYHYRARQGEGFSADAIFHTAPDPGTPFRFAWLADFRTNVAVHDTIALHAFEANPLMSLYGGDLCANPGYASFKEQFFRPNELALIAQVPFFNVPGNHEGWTQNTKAFTQSPASASGTQDYYSLDYGAVHVLMLNTQIPYDEESPQFKFAQADLAQTTKPWKIVGVHKPAYCAGGHNEDAGVKIMTEKIFEPNKVDLVVAGHSHFFQHNIVNGIHHFVLGTVGAPLYNPGSAPYTVKSAKEYDYGIFDVTPTSLTLRVYNEKYVLLDSLSLSRPQ
jgi:predicted phosphodiesterase